MLTIFRNQGSVQFVDNLNQTKEMLITDNLQRSPGIIIIIIIITP